MSAACLLALMPPLASEPVGLALVEAAKITVTERATEDDDLADVAVKDGAPPPEPANVDSVPVSERDTRRMSQGRGVRSK